MMIQKNIKTSDNIEISTHHFNPSTSTSTSSSTSTSEPISNVLIAPATGVTQRFYANFAKYLASNGFKAITFDFRDIGESKVGRMKESKASFTNWALEDFKAVFEDSLKERRTAVVGHSFGALAYCIQEKANEALGLYGLGTGSGNSSFMKLDERIKAEFLWKFLAPLLVLKYGYLPGHLSGMGSHIPKGVYLEWKKWCGYKNFWFGDSEFDDDLKARISLLSTAIKIVVASDDPWMSLDSAKAVYGVFDKGNVYYDRINVGEHKVGHVGYFKEENKELFWGDILTWLNNISF